MGLSEQNGEKPRNPWVNHHYPRKTKSMWIIWRCYTRSNAPIWLQLLQLVSIFEYGSRQFCTPYVLDSYQSLVNSWKSWSSVGKGGTSGIYCSQQLSTFQLTTTHLVICGNLRWQGCAVKAPRGVVCIYNYIGLLQKGPVNTQNDRSLSTDPNLILPIPRPIPTSHWYSLGTFHYRMLFKLGTEFVTYSHDYPLVI